MPVIRSPEASERLARRQAEAFWNGVPTRAETQGVINKALARMRAEQDAKVQAALLLVAEYVPGLAERIAVAQEEARASATTPQTPADVGAGPSLDAAPDAGAVDSPDSPLPGD